MFVPWTRWIFSACSSAEEVEKLKFHAEEEERRTSKDADPRFKLFS